MRVRVRVRVGVGVFCLVLCCAAALCCVALSSHTCEMAALPAYAQLREDSIQRNSFLLRSLSFAPIIDAPARVPHDRLKTPAAKERTHTPCVHFLCLCVCVVFVFVNVIIFFYSSLQ